MEDRSRHERQRSGTPSVRSWIAGRTAPAVNVNEQFLSPRESCNIVTTSSAVYKNERVSATVTSEMTEVRCSTVVSVRMTKEELGALKLQMSPFWLWTLVRKLLAKIRLTRITAGIIGHGTV